MTYRTAAAARIAALRIVALYPDALVLAQVIRLPGIEPSYAPAVRLRFGAVAPECIMDVMVLEAEPPPPPPPAKPPKSPKVPKQPPPKRDPVNRVGQTDKMVGLLRRPEGVSSHELFEAMGVKSHTTRALLSRLRRKMTIVRGEDGQYRVVQSSVKPPPV